LTDFLALPLGLHGVLAGAGAAAIGIITTFVLIMIVAVISIALITTGSMETETGSMILGIDGVLPIGIKLPVTDLELPIRVEPPVIVLAFKGRTQVQLEAEAITMVVTPTEAITTEVTPMAVTPMAVTPMAVTPMEVIILAAEPVPMVVAIDKDLRREIKTNDWVIIDRHSWIMLLLRINFKKIFFYSEQSGYALNENALAK
jgi:hypothetical protein